MILAIYFWVIFVYLISDFFIYLFLHKREIPTASIIKQYSTWLTEIFVICESHICKLS